MKSFPIHLRFIVFALLLGSSEASLAQSTQPVLNWSTYLGGNAEDNFGRILVDEEGNTYVGGQTTSSNLPVTTGAFSAYKGEADNFLAKISPDGKLLYLTYIGGVGQDGGTDAFIDGKDHIYLYGISSSSDYTTGAQMNSLSRTSNHLGNPTYNANFNNIAPTLAKFEKNTMTPVLVTWLPQAVGANQKPETIEQDGYLYLALEYANNTTTGFAQTCIYIIAPDNTATFIPIPGNMDERYPAGDNMEIAPNGDVIISGFTNSTNFVTTDGTTKGAGYDIFIRRYSRTGTLIFSTLIGGNGNDYTNTNHHSLRLMPNGNIILAGAHTSSNFPNTNGVTGLGGGFDVFVAGYSPTGTRLFVNKYRDSGTEVNALLEVHPDGQQVILHTGLTSDAAGAVITPNAVQPIHGGGTDWYIAFLNPNTGATNYGTWYGGAGDDAPNYTVEHAVSAQSILFTGTTTGTFDFPTTSGAVNHKGEGSLLLLNADGSMDLAANIGSVIYDIHFDDDYIYTAGTNSSGGGQGSLNAVQKTSNSAAQSSEIYVSKIRRCDGALAYGTYLGGTNTDNVPAAWFDNKRNTFIGEGGLIYVSGQTASNNFPTTEGAIDNSFNGGVRDIHVEKFDMNAVINFTANTIGPDTQVVCFNGLATALEGSRISVADTLPRILRNGVPTDYPEQQVQYQWQVSDSPSGPWANISGGVDRDYLPNVAETNQYYRRLAINPHGPSCVKSENIISISNVAAVLASLPRAPLADAGPPLRICAGESIQVGGSPTAIPGDSPTLTYQWTEGINPISTVANPTVTPAVTSVYTVTVTDDNGCKDLAQTTVTVLTIDAGPNQLRCGNNSPGVQIGTPPVAGFPGVTYNWTLNSGADASGTLSCTNCAQPIATPTSTTTYRLTVTFPSDAGTTCMLTDNVTVTVEAAPNANFAGPDTYICLTNTMLTDMASLGTPAQPGFTYTWAPGTYLSSTTTSQTTFNAGTNLPVPNPVTYTLTAVRNASGCVYTDQVKVYGLKADAGDDRCPKQMGDINDPYNGQATYRWRVIAGTGGISSDGDCIAEATGLGATVAGNDLNVVRAIDSKTDNNSTTYELMVTFGGFQCRDTVEIYHSPCNGCIFDIQTVSGNCPAFGEGDTLWLNPVTEIGTPWPEEGWRYKWTGPGKIINPAGYTAGLTNPTPGWYYLTISSIDEITHSSCESNSTGFRMCMDSIYINAANYAYPTYSAPDELLCPGDMITIGSPEVAGYSYSWTDLIDFESNLAQPTISPLENKTYYVTVTDVATITPTAPNGCFVVDTVEVTVSEVVAVAGVDRTVCDNTLVTLGQPDPSGGVWQYEWSPQMANYQNGTTYTDAQPQVLVGGSTQTFSVTVTNPASGCSATDQITITINNSPTIANAPNKTICEGSAVQIGPLPLEGVTYSWSPVDGLSDPNIAQPLAKPGSTTTYTVTATFPGSCASQPTDDVTVTVNPLPTVNLTDLSICPGPSLQLTGPTGFSSYSWSPSTNMNNSAIRTPTITPAPTTATAYELRVTNAAGCSNTGRLVVTPAVEPNAGQDRILCVGEKIAIGNADNSGLGTITWTGISGAPIGALSATNIASPIFNSAVSGVGTFTYQISINNGMGCTNTDRVTITVQGINPPVLAATSVCQGGCTTIGTTALPDKLYSWSPSTGLSSPNSSMTLACPTTTTEYILVVQDLITGCVTSSKVTVAIAPVQAPIASAPDTTVCQATEFTLPLSVTPAGGNYTYVWSPATNLSSPYVANPTIVLNQTTTFTITVTDNDNGCSNITQATVTVDNNTNPLEIMANGPALICATDSPSFTVSSNSSTQNLRWSSSGSGTFSPDNMMGMVLYNLSRTDRQQNLLILTVNAQSVCDKAADQINISISDIDVEGTSLMTPVSCEVDNGSCTVNVEGFIGTPEFSIDYGQTWQTNNTFAGLKPGNYLILIRDVALPDCVTQTTVRIPEYDCIVPLPQPVRLN